MLRHRDPCGAFRVLLEFQDSGLADVEAQFEPRRADGGDVVGSMLQSGDFERCRVVLRADGSDVNLLGRCSFVAQVEVFDGACGIIESEGIGIAEALAELLAVAV